MARSRLTSAIRAMSLISTACAFNLNTPGPDWDYTSSDLANTTSEACKTAWGHNIACTDTLLGVTASMRPGFSPTSSDLDEMCVQLCSDSLSDWIRNVNDACNQPGDLALQGQGNIGVPGPKVGMVGEVFRFFFDRSCRKDSSGSYCYLSADHDGSGTASTFACNDTCNVEFYTIAHNDPGSQWEFNYYYLVSQIDGWEKALAKGWQSAKNCPGVKDTNPAADNITLSSSAVQDPQDSTLVMTAGAAPTETGLDGGATAVPLKPTPAHTTSDGGAAGSGGAPASSTSSATVAATSTAAAVALHGRLPVLGWAGLGLLGAML